MPFSAMAMSACVAPRVEIYTELVCRAHKPEYKTGRRFSPMHFDDPQMITNFTEVLDIGVIAPTLNYTAFEAPNPCAKDPEVNAAAAKLIAGEFEIKSIMDVIDGSVAMTSVMGVLSCLTTGFWGTVRYHSV